MSIEEFKINANNLIKAIDQYCLYLISDKHKEATEHQTTLISNIENTIPQLIQMCMEEDPEDQYGNVAYWTSQLNKCIVALEKGDAFAIVDAFYYEMKPTLLAVLEAN